MCLLVFRALDANVEGCARCAGHTKSARVAFSIAAVRLTIRLEIFKPCKSCSRTTNKIFSSACSKQISDGFEVLIISERCSVVVTVRAMLSYLGERLRGRVLRCAVFTHEHGSGYEVMKMVLILRTSNRLRNCL